MPDKNDSYTVTLKKAHLEWGTHRHTSTRGVIYGEGYIQIPASIARQLDIFNSNHTSANIIYSCSSSDGYLTNVSLKACGCSRAGDILAKQFEGNGDLKLLGDWFHNVGAQIGDQVQIDWQSPTSIIITRI